MSCVTFYGTHNVVGFEKSLLPGQKGRPGCNGLIKRLWRRKRKQFIKFRQKSREEHVVNISLACVKLVIYKTVHNVVGDANRYWITNFKKSCNCDSTQKRRGLRTPLQS